MDEFRLAQDLDVDGDPAKGKKRAKMKKEVHQMARRRLKRKDSKTVQEEIRK